MGLFGREHQDDDEDGQAVMLRAMTGLAASVERVAEEFREFRRVTVARLDRMDPAGALPDPVVVDLAAEERDMQAALSWAEIPAGQAHALINAGMLQQDSDGSLFEAQMQRQARAGWNVVVTDNPGMSETGDRARVARINADAMAERAGRSVPGRASAPGFE